jgi:hypothetical protein
MMLCLSLWGGPVPVLHAHEMSGEILDRDPKLAVHVQQCHLHDDCEDSCHWHWHLVLWGEILPDSSDSETPPPVPQPKHTGSDQALPIDGNTATSGLAELESESWSTVQGISGHWFAPLPNATESLDRVTLFPYQTRVKDQRDVGQLLMVARC